MEMNSPRRRSCQIRRCLEGRPGRVPSTKSCDTAYLTEQYHYVDTKSHTTANGGRRNRRSTSNKSRCISGPSIILFSDTPSSFEAASNTILVLWYLSPPSTLGNEAGTILIWSAHFWNLRHIAFLCRCYVGCSFEPLFGVHQSLQSHVVMVW